MGGLLRIALLVLLILAAVLAGGIVGVLFYRWLLSRSQARYVHRSAMKLREGLLEEFPPGPRPEIRITPADDLAEEQWDYLVEKAMAVETAQGYRLAEWGPEGGVPISDVLEKVKERKYH